MLLVWPLLLSRGILVVQLPMPGVTCLPRLPLLRRLVTARLPRLPLPVLPVVSLATTTLV